MRRWIVAFLGLGALTSLGGENPPAASPAAARASGIDRSSFDDSVRPQDDLYGYVNGRWLATFEIPPDKGSYAQFTKVLDDTQAQLRALVDGLQASPEASDPDQRKLADLYGALMDEGTVEALGRKPLAGELARIEALGSRRQLARLIAHLNRIGVPAPITPQVHQDARDATRYVFDLGQDGLGMPDRDYYLQDEDRLKQVRSGYLEHIRKMLALAGDTDAAREAREVVALETALAKIQWTKVENRDPIKTYNKFEFGKLKTLAGGYDWASYLLDSGVQGKIDYLIISQPSYLAGLDTLLQHTPLRVWKSYFRLRVLKAFAPYLSTPFVDENFAFDGMALHGTRENEARWKRGVELLDAALGEALGKLYVARYFPPSSKERMDRLVTNLQAAYKADIGTLDWMGPETRRRALDKLALFDTKIGYPIRTRDYGTLQITRGDLVGNVVRANEFEYRRNLDKLGRPIDRDEWEMTAPTVDAYYEPQRNEIVFPAGILQPPFFNADADDAVNYGAIGAVIGHEISHGFDDQGSQYDGHGNLLDPPGWFTQDDLQHFKQRTHVLVQQYAAISPLPGYPINGELTLGENIADNSGLVIAYKAYELSLGGKPSPVIDGLTGEQRFYMGWVQAWRGKTRDNELVMRLKSDPHSPVRTRGTLPEMNQSGFYEAFGVKPGDKMYLPPEQRFSLW